MPAPKKPNTAAATAAVVRRGQETTAARLRAAGWLALPPEVVAKLPADVLARLGDFCHTRAIACGQRKDGTMDKIPDDLLDRALRAYDDGAGHDLLRTLEAVVRLAYERGMSDARRVQTNGVTSWASAEDADLEPVRPGDVAPMRHGECDPDGRSCK